MCLLQHPPPQELGGSPLSACVRATAEQQAGKVFSGGATPGLCDSPVASDLQKEPSVCTSAIADTFSALSPRLPLPLVTGCDTQTFPFYCSIFLMANVCVLPPLP